MRAWFHYIFPALWPRSSRFVSDGGSSAKFRESTSTSSTEPNGVRLILSHYFAGILLLWLDGIHKPTTANFLFRLSQPCSFGWAHLNLIKSNMWDAFFKRNQVNIKVKISPLLILKSNISTTKTNFEKPPIGGGARG